MGGLIYNFEVSKKVLKSFGKGWLKFAHVLGKINQFIFLFLIYFVVIGIYALLGLPFRWRFGLKTNWKPSPNPLNLSDLKNPF